MKTEGLIPEGRQQVMMQCDTQRCKTISNPAREQFPRDPQLKTRSTWVKFYKTFQVSNLRNFRNEPECLSLAGSFQPSLMFVGKGWSLTMSRVHRKNFTRVGSGIARRHQIRLERLARDKRSSLLFHSINEESKKFCSIGHVNIINFSTLSLSKLECWSVTSLFSLVLYL